MSILPLKWLIQAYIVVVSIYIVLADTQYNNRSYVNASNEAGRSIASSPGDSQLKPFKPSPLAAVSKKKQKSLRPSSYYKYYNHSQKRDDSFGSNYGAPTGGGVVGYFPPEPPLSSLTNSAYGQVDQSSYGSPHLTVPESHPHSNYGASAPALPNSNYGASGSALPLSNYGAVPSGPSLGPESGHEHGHAHVHDISIPSHGFGVQSSYNAPSAALVGSSYSAPVSSSYASPASYEAPISMSYGAPTMSYGAPTSYGVPGGYGADDYDKGSGKGKGKGLIGLIGLLGLKGLLPKAFSILSALFPLILLLAVPLVVINLPMILPLALPLLLPLLLPVLLPVIALAALFVPIPVIATGRRNFLEQKREEFSRAIHNVIHEDQCIERISCQISNAAKKYGISYEPIKSIITKNDKYASMKWMKNILKGFEENSDCKKYTCSWNSSGGGGEVVDGKKEEQI